MADQAAQLDVVINSIANTSGFAVAKAELAGLGGGGFTPLGGGTVNFGGSLTRDEQATAAAQLATLEVKSKGAASAARELTTELNTGARAASALGSEGAAAAGRLGALGSVMSSGGAFSLGVGAAIIGLGGLYEMGKSMVENADQQETATRSLAQAYATLGEKVPTQEIGKFIDLNARFTGNMYDVEQGFASFARAGMNDTMQLRLMNDAVDLAAAKHGTLSDAVKILTSSSTGMSRGLLELGVSQKDVNAALAKGSTEAERYQALLALLEPRIYKARDTTSNLTQSEKDLSVTWEKMSNDNGPALIGMLGAVVDRTDKVLNGMRSSDWGGFSATLVGLATGWHNLTIQIDNATNAFQNWLIKSGVTTSAGSKAGYGGKFGAADPRTPAAVRAQYILTSN